MTRSLDYDAAGHRYMVDGREWPGVTQVLAPLVNFDGVPTDVLERKRDLGNALHAAIELDHDGDLDEDTIHPDVLPYFEAWRAFVDETTPEIHGFEVPMISERYRYGGTPDLWCELDGESGREPWILDTKTVAQLSPVYGLQTAAYRQLLAERYGPQWSDARRGVLWLRPGTGWRWQVEEYREPTDWPVFMSLLNLHQWRTRHAL